MNRSQLDAVRASKRLKFVQSTWWISRKKERSSALLSSWRFLIRANKLCFLALWWSDGLQNSFQWLFFIYLLTDRQIPQLCRRSTRLIWLFWFRIAAIWNILTSRVKKDISDDLEWLLEVVTGMQTFSFRYVQRVFGQIFHSRLILLTLLVAFVITSLICVSEHLKTKE